MGEDVCSVGVVGGCASQCSKFEAGLAGTSERLRSRRTNATRLASKLSCPEAGIQGHVIKRRPRGPVTNGIRSSRTRAYTCFGHILQTIELS
jgi:hypothetical protein